MASGSVPDTGGMSRGDGRKSTTASSIGCTPLFLNAEPQMTGTNGASSLRTDSMTRLRSAALISSSVIASPPRYFSSSLSSASLTFSMSFSRYGLRLGHHVGRDLADDVVGAHASRPCR